MRIPSLQTPRRIYPRQAKSPGANPRHIRSRSSQTRISRSVESRTFPKSYCRRMNKSLTSSTTPDLIRRYRGKTALTPLTIGIDLREFALKKEPGPEIRSGPGSFSLETEPALEFCLVALSHLTANNFALLEDFGKRIAHLLKGSCLLFACSH